MVAGLLHTPVGERNFLDHLAQAIQNGAVDHGLGRARIDDLRADVAGSPDVRDADFVGSVHSDLSNFSEVAQVAEVGGDTHTGARGLLARLPVRFFSDKLQYRGKAFWIQRVFAALAVLDRLGGEQFKLEIERVTTGSMGTLVEEGLANEADSIAARSAQRAGAEPKRHSRGVNRIVRYASRWELVGVDVAAGGVARAFAVSDEVLPVGRELTRFVDAGLEVMEASGAKIVVDEIVFARP